MSALPDRPSAQAMTRQEALALALEWAAVRWPAFPVRLTWNPGKNNGAGSIDKRPTPTHGHLEATTDPAQIEALFAAVRLNPGEEIGVGVVPGAAGYVVVDGDVKDGKRGLETLQRLEAEHGAFAAWRYTTPSGGLNVICRKPPGATFGNSSPPDWEGVDVRADSGWIVAPGTRTSWGSGQWAECFGERADAVEIPAGMAAQLQRAHTARPTASSADARAWLEAHRGPTTPPAGEALSRKLHDLARSTSGSRHGALVATVGWIVGMHQLDQAEALEQLQSVWDQITPGEGRGYEPLEVLQWTIPQEQAKQRAVGTATATTRLPFDFWQARPALAQIREAAHSRVRSADLVLHAVLARLSAYTPHTYEIPAIVGSAGSLNYFAAVVGPSGSGKSTGVTIAAELVPRPVGLKILADRPLGSGEGLAEAYMGEVEVPRDDGKKPTKKREQVRWNAFVYGDEGAALTAMMERSGATLPESIRRAWTGAALGQANASKDTTREIPAGQYRLGMLVGFQPELAGHLLADANAGTPQRFLWASAIDPTIPDPGALPPWPGPLEIPTIPPAVLNMRETSRSGLVRHTLDVAPAIADGLRSDAVAAARGTARADALDSHRPLHLLKTAGLLAILDGRLDIDAEDWHLAQAIWTTSVAVRTGVVAAVAAEAERTAEGRVQYHARRELAAEAARSSAGERVDRIARRLGLYAHGQRDSGSHPAEGFARRNLYGRLASTERDLFDPAITHAIAHGWLAEHEGRFGAGPSRPA